MKKVLGENEKTRQRKIKTDRDDERMRETEQKQCHFLLDHIYPKSEVICVYTVQWKKNSLL